MPHCWQDSTDPQASDSLLVPPVSLLLPAVSVCCLLQATEGQRWVGKRDTPCVSCSSEHLVLETEAVVPAVHSLLLALHHPTPCQDAFPCPFVIRRRQDIPGATPSGRWVINTHMAHCPVMLADIIIPGRLSRDFCSPKNVQNGGCFTSLDL